MGMGCIWTRLRWASLHLLNPELSPNFLMCFVLPTEGERKAKESASGRSPGKKGEPVEGSWAMTGKTQSHCLFIPPGSAHSVYLLKTPTGT